MKKTYIAPEIEVFRVETATMLAGSNTTLGVTNEEVYEGWADSPELFDDGSVDW